jgi:PAS domain S-box-containing protein
MVESSPNLIGIFQDGVLKYVNNATIHKLGWTYEELVSPSFDPIENVVSQKSRSLVRENVGKNLRGEDVAPDEISLTRKDGSEVLVLATGAKIIYNQKPAIEFVFDDITERKRLEEAYRTVVENALQGLAISQDNHWVFANQALLKMSGYSLDELLSRSQDDVLAAVHPKDRERVRRYIQDILANKSISPRLELPLSKKDGTTIWVEALASRIQYQEKPAVQVAYADITERKRVEEKLRESEERYRSLFDRMLDGVYLSTHEGRFVDVNPVFVKMFGYSSEQEMLDIADIKKELYFSPEERGRHILDADQEEVKEFRMRRKDGSEIWVEDHGGYVYDEQGNIIYHEGILRDITERKRLEEKLRQYSLHLEELVAERTGELRESEEKYRELFEACPVSLWEEDFSAVKQFLDELRQKGVSDLGAYLANHPEDVAKCAGLVKVLNMNKATLNLYNAKSVDEILGGLSGVLTEESNRKQFAGELVALVQGKKHYEAEMENRTLRGETKHCNVICAVVTGYEQSLAKVLVCIVDLTPQKKLEAELVKTQRLAAIGETAAMVGHDLRNPLQGIAGALYLLKQESLTAEERNEMLQLIQDNVEHSDAIVGDLLDYSSEIQLEPIEITPKSITSGAIEAVKVPERVTVLDLSVDHPVFRVDSDKMRRVFINLIENAIDAMPQGGTLTISSRKSDGNVEIAFTDTGLGIPEKVMQNLWKPLQTTKAKGMGLGLAICKRIVDAHGGNISAKSKIGEGTIVTVRLPIKPDEVKRK